MAVVARLLGVTMMYNAWVDGKRASPAGRLDDERRGLGGTAGLGPIAWAESPATRRSNHHRWTGISARGSWQRQNASDHPSHCLYRTGTAHLAVEHSRRDLHQ